AGRMYRRVGSLYAARRGCGRSGATGVAGLMGGAVQVWLRRGGVLLAVALVVSVAMTVLTEVRGSFDDPRRHTRELDAKALVVELPAGNVQVRAGEVAKVRLTRVQRGDPQISERLDGGTLRVASRCPGLTFDRCDIAYELVVPADGPVRADVDSGDVTVSGVSGRLDLHADSGDVTATDLTSTEVNATTDSGDVELGFRRAPTRVQADADSGDVTVRVPKGTRYRVDGTTGSGSRDVEVGVDPESGHRIIVTTSSGDVEVR